MEVVGRSDAVGAASERLDAVADGPAALVYDGEAGIGKTTVWEAALAEAAARGFTVLTTRPGKADAAVAFAALVDLLEDVAQPVLELLPRPQRTALRAAVLDADAHADRLALGMATRNVVRQVALARPLVLAIDDLQWLDLESGQALEFALRRLAADPVLVLATARAGEHPAVEPTSALSHARVHRFPIRPLGPGEIAALLRARLGLALAREPLRMLTDACGGNPLFALEIGRSAQAGTTELVPGRPLSLGRSLHDLLAARVAAVPPALGDALLTVAALADPRPADVAADALAAAEEIDLLHVEDGRVRFSHPLLRAAVYDRAPAAARRAKHRELARRVDDPVERAFHLALGTDAADAAAAAEIEAAAERAARRGAREAAAKLFEHAARLTPATEDRVRRRLGAVEQLLWAGARDRAEPLLASAEAEAPRGPLAALAVYWRVAWEDDPAERERMLAAACAEADDATLVLLLLARGSSLFATRSFARGRELAYRALELAEKLGRRELVVAAMATAVFDDMAVGAPVDHDRVRAVLAVEDELNAEGIDPEDTLRMAYGQLLTYSGALDAARPLLERQVERAREAGYPPYALPHLAVLEWRAGNLDLALRHVRDFAAEAPDDATQRAWVDFIASWPLATRGDADDALAAIDAAQSYFEAAEEAVQVVGCHNMRGFVAFSLDDHEAAAREYLAGIAIMRGLEWREVGVHAIYQHCAQALVALGRLEEAEALIVELEELARPIARVPALAGALRARTALAISRGEYDDAIGLCTESLELQSTLPEPFDLAHTRLVLGTALRCAHRKAEARAELVRAAAEFEAIGARLWHAKAGAELGRIGGRAAAAGLTATEKQIATLVAAGRTNQEVAAALFVSPKTVEWNLSKIYRKLRVASRVELAAKLAGREAASRRAS